VTILVDATPRGEAPGTLYTIEPDLNELETVDASAMAVETHGMNPMKVLSLVKSMGGKVHKILLVGCEPETFGAEEGCLGLSPTVAATVSEASRMVTSLVEKFQSETVKLAP